MAKTTVPAPRTVLGIWGFLVLIADSASANAQVAAHAERYSPALASALDVGNALLFCVSNLE